MTFGERIYKMRTEKGMTQDELATAVGYRSRSTIAKIEAGKRDAPQSMIVALAKALNTTPAYLMGWEAMDQTKEELDMPSKMAEIGKELIKDLVDTNYSSDSKYIVYYYNRLNAAGKIEATRRVREMASLDEYTVPDEDKEVKNGTT